MNIHEHDPSRRHFLGRLTAAASAPLWPSVSARKQQKRGHLKMSLNAFSFNDPLTKGAMTIDDMLTYCAATGFAAVDITAYYFKGYPAVPDDAYLYHIKRQALRLGMEISGTGVRNDFTEPDHAKRRESVKLVKAWIDAAEKIGAPVIRIFAGNQPPGKHSRKEMLNWMIDDIADVVAHGERHGVVVGIQNHDDFVKTAADALEIMNALKSEWFGLILDTGSYRVGDPYSQIEQTARFAVNWQIKEMVYYDGKETQVDADRLIRIIRASGYKGYIPLETLGAGDPKVKVEALFNRVSNALSKS